MLVLLGMFGKIPLWSHPVRDFCLLGVFFCFVLFCFTTASISVGVICLIRFSDSPWFSFGRLYVCRNLSISSRLSTLLAYIFLQSFLFLWCQLLFLFFHFWFYFFGSSLFFSWWVWLKVCQSYLSFQRKSSCLLYLFFLDSISFISDLSWLLPPFYSLCAFFVVGFLVFLGVGLDCLFEIFLASWKGPLMLWTSLLVLFFAVSHRFWIVCLFSLVFKYFFYFFHDLTDDSSII